MLRSAACAARVARSINPMHSIAIDFNGYGLV
jgi:hypothetical protein